MIRKEVQKIINEVYPHIEKHYGFSKFQECTPFVEVHHNIYARYSGIEDADGDETPDAEFDADDNTIYVYFPQMKSRKHIIQTLIHEYKHYLQSPLWMKRYRTMGYDYFTHPYEIQALEEEKNWKIFDSGNSSIKKVA